MWIAAASNIGQEGNGERPFLINRKDVKGRRKNMKRVKRTHRHNEARCYPGKSTWLGTGQMGQSAPSSPAGSRRVRTLRAVPFTVKWGSWAGNSFGSCWFSNLLDLNYTRVQSPSLRRLRDFHLNGPTDNAMHQGKETDLVRSAALVSPM